MTVAYSSRPSLFQAVTSRLGEPGLMFQRIHMPDSQDLAGSCNHQRRSATTTFNHRQWFLRDDTASQFQEEIRRARPPP